MLDDSLPTGVLVIGIALVVGPVFWWMADRISEPYNRIHKRYGWPGPLRMFIIGNRDLPDIIAAIFFIKVPDEEYELKNCQKDARVMIFATSTLVGAVALFFKIWK